MSLHVSAHELPRSRYVRRRLHVAGEEVQRPDARVLPRKRPCAHARLPERPLPSSSSQDRQEYHDSAPSLLLPSSSPQTFHATFSTPPAAFAERQQG
jgi:hypothetical protein